MENAKGRDPEAQGPSPIDILQTRVAELEGQHRVGMLHACALLSLTVYDSDGEPLDQTKLLAMCDESDADLIADDGPEGDGFRYA